MTSLLIIFLLPLLLSIPASLFLLSLFDISQRRYTRVNSQGGSLYSGPGPEYDDPANCAPEEDQYGSQYGGPYGQPYDHYGSRGSMGRRSIGKYAREREGI